MPNHVKSVITISGNRENIAKVADLIIVTEGYRESLKERNIRLREEFRLPVPPVGSLSFNRLIPTPGNIFQLPLSRKDEEKYGKENCWYDWNRTNWGTKWDAYEVETDVAGEFIHIEFWTAWSHPRKYMEALARVCAENGCDLNGEFADEDFGGLMGIYRLSEDTDGSESPLHVACADYDAEIYESVWGCSPYDDEESDDGDGDGVQ